MLEGIPFIGYPSKYSIIFESSFFGSFLNNSERFSFTVTSNCIEKCARTLNFSNNGVFMFCDFRKTAGVLGGDLCIAIWRNYESKKYPKTKLKYKFATQFLLHF